MYLSTSSLIAANSDWFRSNSSIPASNRLLAQWSESQRSTWSDHHFSDCIMWYTWAHVTWQMIWIGQTMKKEIRKQKYEEFATWVIKFSFRLYDNCKFSIKKNYFVLLMAIGPSDRKSIIEHFTNVQLLLPVLGNLNFIFKIPRRQENCALRTATIFDFGLNIDFSNVSSRFAAAKRQMLRCCCKSTNMQ